MKIKIKNKKSLGAALSLLLAFLIWTILLCFIDKQPIGPMDTSVGFASLNSFFHGITGVHFWLYYITDWLGLIPIGFAIGFAILGLFQLIQRRSLLKVDFSILSLGVFYILVLAFFIFFENVIINFRPILINGYLEASYPSSTTLLTTCVMPTAIMQLNFRIRKRRARNFTAISLSLFVAFMVIARLISGVHWLSDIVGGLLLGGGLVMIYRSVNFK